MIDLRETNYTLGSLFDGMGGWQLSAVRCGITPAWSSEIEKFPRQVTAQHFPNTKQLGDITKINGAEIEPVDIICMGSPCQDLSVAGKRKGLDGEKSGLFRAAINIIRDMRRATKGKYPRFIVWENVPGAFSSNGRRDFRAVLEEIAETEIPMPASGKWANAGMVRSNSCDIAWRVLDAQYWGVPQRRKRIFLVADFRGQCAGDVLFKPESVPWYIAPSKGKREGAAFYATDSARVSSLGFSATDSIANSMPVLEDKTPPIKTNNRLGVLAFKSGQGSSARSLGMAIDMSPTLSASAGGNTVPAILTYCIAGNTIDRKIENGGNGKGINEEVSFTLNTIDRHAVYALDCRNICTNEVSATLQSKNQGGYSLNYQNPIYAQNKVRRLTPTECERLQGLPDKWTVGGSDSVRYKAIGNGMAQCCADYVMQNIRDVLMEGNHET